MPYYQLEQVTRAYHRANVEYLRVALAYRRDASAYAHEERVRAKAAHDATWRAYLVAESYVAQQHGSK